VVDLRSAPTAGGWSIDLARDVLPAVPPRCATFSASSFTDPLVVLTGEAPPLGSSTDCAAFVRTRISATVALFDPATGSLRWSHDLSRDFPYRSSPLQIGQASVVRPAGRVVVQLTVDGVYTVAALSLANGDVLASTTLDANAVGAPPQIAGTLVLFGGTTSREGSTSWQLVDARRVGRPLWTGVVDDSRQPVLTRSAVFATVDGRSIRADGVTGRVTRLGDGTVDLSSAGVVDATTDAFYTVRSVPFGLIVEAWGGDGRRLWSRSGVGALTGVTRDCVVTSTYGGGDTRCLDRATGRSRWSSPVTGNAFAGAVAGQTTNDVALYKPLGSSLQQLVLDGSTGRVKYTLPAADQAYIAAAGPTVGYLIRRTASGSSIGVRAFDTESGRTLWSRGDTREGRTALWGGHFVLLSADGVATELVDPPGIVLGR
jgi:outer membrane protein assembly factor BamB